MGERSSKPTGAFFFQKYDSTSAVHYVEALFRWTALLLAVPSLAVAQADVAVGPDGLLGTFRRLPNDADPAQVDPACPECPVVVSHEERIDLQDWAGNDETLVLGLTLRTTIDTATQLFVGVVGELEVFLDGTRIARFDRGHEREDDRRVRLALPTGTHRLVLRLNKPPRRRGIPVYRWRLRTRFVDDAFQPGFGAATASVGPLEPERALVAAREAITLDESYRLVDGTPTAILKLHAPLGGIARPLACELGETRTLQPSDGVWRDALESRTPLSARFPEAKVEGETQRARVLGLARPLLRAMQQIHARLDSLDENERGPMQWRLEEMQRAIDQRDPDSRWRSFLVSDTRRRLRSRFGRSPRGYQRMAHVSRLDGTAQPYELFVPPAYRPNRAWPVLITLHGFKGNAGDYFRNTFGLARDWRGGETLDAHGRHGTEPTEGPMIVIGPQGRGQTYYRQAGEVDIMEALADVERRYNVDPRRIYITGGSMGGTGAAWIPFRYPGRFAAAAALAGYHDQRVRQDTHHPGLTDIERFLQARRSDVDWTENAQDLPMLLVRGTRDRPLEWTRVQVERLRELGFRHEHREPELGHNVWTETYAEGAIFEWLGRYRRPRRVRHLRFRTARERTHTHRWLRVDGRSAPDVFASVDARVSDDGVAITTEHVAGLTLLPEASLPEGELAITLDGQSFRAAPPASFHREGQRWASGALDLRGRKRQGVSGPIRDVYYEPLVFVVGTGDPAHTAMNRRVAEDWAHPAGWDVRYPIVEDTALTPEIIATKTLVLVGPPRSNALLARWRRQLPIQFERDAIVLRGQRHRGPQVGTVFVAPNPDVPDHSILVIAGITPLGTWRARFLPDVLADYVIFDERVQNARGQWSCGGARRDDGSPNGANPVECAYRAHGFFDMHWR